jgi:hypothetical protein
LDSGHELFKVGDYLGYKTLEISLSKGIGGRYIMESGQSDLETRCVRTVLHNLLLLTLTL